jgi:hypothetical protein
MLRCRKFATRKAKSNNVADIRLVMIFKCMRRPGYISEETFGWARLSSTSWSGSPHHKPSPQAVNKAGDTTVVAGEHRARSSGLLAYDRSFATE